VVVGGAKSAVDCAVEASRQGAAQVTMLQRRAHWPTPREIAGLLPFQYVFLSRFGQTLVSMHRGPLPYAGGAIKAARVALWPLVAPAFSVVEALFALQLGLLGERRPRTDVVDDFFGYGHVLDSQLSSLRKQGRIAVRLGEIERVEEEMPSVRLKDGAEIDADVVIYATGFKSDYLMLPTTVTANLDLAEDGLWLYRYIVPPRVQNLACIGKVAAISNISAYGVQAEWLARHIAGGTIPDLKTMEQEVEVRKLWARSWMPHTPGRASLVLLHQIQYYDRMMQVMGERPGRKTNPLAEYLMPYLSRDFDGIGR
jgi:dimethylaniline monooxygenase (N-oxide forming)